MGEWKRVGMEWDLAQVGDGFAVGKQAAMTDFLSFAQRDPALAGRLRLVAEPLAEGAMGTLAGAVKVVGVAARVLASTLVTWLNAYSSDVTIQITRPDGSHIEMSVNRLQRARADELPLIAVRLAAVLDGTSNEGTEYVRMVPLGDRPSGVSGSQQTGDRPLNAVEPRFDPLLAFIRPLPVSAEGTGPEQRGEIGTELSPPGGAGHLGIQAGQADAGHVHREQVTQVLVAGERPAEIPVVQDPVE